MTAREIPLFTTWQPVPLDAFRLLRDLAAALTAGRASVVSCRSAQDEYGEQVDGAVEYFIAAKDVTS